MPLRTTQPLIEMTVRCLPGDRGMLELKADNLTAVCELTLWKMWESRRLATQLASKGSYRDTFIFFTF
jgi:hypothetical protein